MKRELSVSLIILGIITLVLITAAAILLWRGSVQSIIASRPNMAVYVQAPPTAEIGSDIELTLMVENDGKEIASIDEIRLPPAMTDSAVIKAVFPSMHPGQQEFTGEYTKYLIGILLEPGERREFKIQLMPWQIADVADNIGVLSGEDTIAVGFRIVFNKPIAEAGSTLTALPTPTQTWTPTPSTVPSPQATLMPTSTSIILPYKSVVKIIAKVKHSSLLRNLWGGSGTIVSEDGYILTNAHLVLPVPGARPDVFVIAITEDPSEPPLEMYYAEPILTDEELDLAVIQITTDMDLRPIDWKNTKLTNVPLGNSDEIQLGEPLTILGYPGIGGQTITLTSGNVGGFTAQKGYGDRAFIKTSATISGGTSGGLVLNSNGQMIAIPTQLGSGVEDEVVDCRVITDTNGDGKINQFDACVPVGGFINALRPINLARAMIDGARRITGSENPQ